MSWRPCRCLDDDEMAGTEPPTGDDAASSGVPSELSFDLGITKRSRGTIQHDVAKWNLHKPEFSAHNYTLAIAAYEKWQRANPAEVPFAVVVRIEETSQSAEIYEEVEERAHCAAGSGDNLNTSRASREASAAPSHVAAEKGEAVVDFNKRLAGKKAEKPLDPVALYDTLDWAHDKGPLSTSPDCCARRVVRASSIDTGHHRKVTHRSGKDPHRPSYPSSTIEWPREGSRPLSVSGQFFGRPDLRSGERVWYRDMHC